MFPKPVSVTEEGSLSCGSDKIEYIESTPKSVDYGTVESWYKYNGLLGKGGDWSLDLEG